MKKQNKDGVKRIFRFCENTVKKIQEFHGLTDYEIVCNFDPKPHPNDQGNRVTIAEIEIDNEYMRANLYVYPKFAQLYWDKQIDELTRILCHEIAHLRTFNIANLAFERYTTKESIKEETERLTEIISRCMYRAMKAEKRI